MRKLLKSHKLSKILLLMSIFTPALGQDSAAKAPSPAEAKPSEHPVIDAAVEATKKTAEVLGNVAHRAREGIHEATKPAPTPPQKTDDDEEEDDEDTCDTIKEKGKDLKDKAGDAKDEAAAKLKKGKRKAERAASDAKDKIEEGTDKAKEKAKDIKDKATS